MYAKPINKLTLDKLLSGDLIELKNPCPSDQRFKRDLLHDFLVEGLSFGVRSRVLPPKNCLEEEIDQILWSLKSYRKEIERLREQQIGKL